MWNIKNKTKENKTKENMTNQNKPENSQQKFNVTDFWHDKKNKDLLFYLVIGIFLLELIVAVCAFFYGIVNSTPGENGLPPRFQFPLLGYAIAAFVTPAIFLLIIHLLGIGLFRSLKRSSVEDDAWSQKLPERIRKIYAIIQGAPTTIVLAGIVALGVALFYIDGAMQALLRLGSALEGYILWIIGGLLLAWCITYSIRSWFKYRLKKLESEYQFRRDIFDSSGIVIVDKGCIQLPPSAVELNAPKMIASSQGEVIEVGMNDFEQEVDKKPSVDIDTDIDTDADIKSNADVDIGVDKKPSADVDIESDKKPNTDIDIAADKKPKSEKKSNADKKPKAEKKSNARKKSNEDKKA